MKPQLVGRHWQVGLLDTSVPGESTVVSANSPRPRRLAAAPGPAPAPTQSAGAFAPPTTPSCSGLPGAWWSSSSLVLGDVAPPQVGWLGDSVSGHRRSRSEAGDPGCLWGQKHPLGHRAQPQSRQEAGSLLGRADGGGPGDTHGAALAGRQVVRRPATSGR